MHVFCIFVFAPVQRNWERRSRDTLIIIILLLLLNLEFLEQNLAIFMSDIIGMDFEDENLHR